MVVARRHVSPSTVTAMRPVNGTPAQPRSPAMAEWEDAVRDLDLAETEVIRARRRHDAALRVVLLERTSDEPALINVAAAARMLGIGASTVREIIAAGDIPRVPVAGNAVRVRPSDVMAYVARRGAR